MPHKKKPRRFITPLVLFTLAGWALWALGRNEPTARRPGPRRPTARARAARGRTARARARRGASAGSPRASRSPPCSSAAPPSRPAPATSWRRPSRATRRPRVTSTEERHRRERSAPGRGSGGRGSEPRIRREPTAEQPRIRPTARPDDGGQPRTTARVPPATAASQATTPTPPGDGSGGNPGDQPPDSGGDAGSGGSAPQDDDGLRPGAVPADPGVGDGPGDSANSGDLPVIDKETREPGRPRSRGGRRRLLRHDLAPPPLPDPTPPAKRLKQRLRAARSPGGERAKVDWALLLGVLRARGFDGGLDEPRARPRRPPAARRARCGRRTPWRALRAYGGGPSSPTRSFALRNYNRAVGLARS